MINDWLMNYAQSSEKTAFITLGDDGEPLQQIQFSQLLLRVKCLAREFEKNNLPGEVCLLVYEDVIEFIVSFLACQYAGIIAVPVFFRRSRSGTERLSIVMKDAGAKTVLTASGLAGAVQELVKDNGDVNVIVTDLPVDEKDISLFHGPCYNEISFLQYTSGSTQTPRGVIVSADNLVHNQKMIQQTFGCNSSSVIFSWLPFHHDMGLIGNILHTIYTGCTCVLMQPLTFIQKPLLWLKAIADYRVTHSGAPNFAYDLCVNKISSQELSMLDLSGWKVAYNGSEPVRAATIQRFADHFAAAGFNASAFYPCYGLAEATLLVSGGKKAAAPPTVSLYKEQDRVLVSSGKVAPGVEVKILSVDDASACEEGKMGEICISGDSVTSGYWGKSNTELFRQVGDEKYLRTGDLGMLHNGELFVNGRIKEVIIVNGKNLFPYDIEHQVSQGAPAIEPNGVAVFSLDEVDNAFVVIAELKRSAVQDADTPNIIDTIDRVVLGMVGIAPYDIILTFPHGIPRTTSGKLQRTKCKQLYREHLFKVIAAKSALSKATREKERDPALLYALVVDATPKNIEAYLLDLIAAKTNTHPGKLVQHMDDLAYAGIDSIRAMELINTINKDLDINITATDLARENTLPHLVKIIENLLWLKNAASSGKEIII